MGSSSLQPNQADFSSPSMKSHREALPSEEVYGTLCVWPLEAKLMGRGSLRSLRLLARSWSLHGLAVTLTCLLPLPQSHSLGPVWRACRVSGDSPRRSLTREERKGEEKMEEGRTRRLADVVTWSARLCPLWALLGCPPTPLATAVEQTLGSLEY